VRPLTKERRSAITNRVAAILRRGDPTPFVFEAACRHGIRSTFCAAGWPWPLADEAAAHIVRVALDRIGARRPRWIEGQLEFVRYDFKLFERTRCRQCGTRLHGDRRTFCSDSCSQAHRWELTGAEERALRAEAARLYWLTWRAAQPYRTCAACGGGFRPNKPNQFLCSQACAARHNRAASHVRA
jgi:hypothetical protein